MPTHRGFHAHIVWADCKSGKVTPSRDFIKEYCKEISTDEKKVTVFIAAEAGRFFAGTWWSNNRNRKTAPLYTAEFIRDGESVHHAMFDRKAAAGIQGIAGEWVHEKDDDDDNEDDEDEESRRYYFMFRSMEVTGEDDNSSTVPAELGQLEIVIRNITDDSEDLDMSTDTDSDSTDSDSESAFSDSSDDDSGSEYDPMGEIKEVRKANAVNRKDVHDVFTDWDNKKPRHTHTTAMARSDGTLWKNQPRCHVPKVRKSISGNENDVVVRFIFFYTSKEYIKMMMQTKTPKTRVSTSPPSGQPGRESSEADDCIQPVGGQHRHGDSSTQTSVKVEQDTGIGFDDTETPSAAKRRRVEFTPGPSLEIKSEDEQKMYAEMLMYTKKAHEIRMAIEASKRARGEAVEGSDKDNPIKVED